MYLYLHCTCKLDSDRQHHVQSVESLAWPQQLPGRDSLALSSALAAADSLSFVGLLRRLQHRGLLRETKLPMDQYRPPVQSN